MNFAKSMFISMYMMFAMGVMGYSGLEIYQGGNSLLWSGVLLTVAPMMMVLSWIMMTKSVARTSASFPIVQFLALTGVGLVVWLNLAGVIDPLAALLAPAGWVMLLVYINWYSVYKRESSPVLQPGRILPEFSLSSVAGPIINSNQFYDRPTVIMFYRGNWCPLCMAQIKELANRYKELGEKGVRIALVSPQPHSNTSELAKKFGVKFEFYIDVGNHAARMLGIQQESGLPMGMQMMGYDSETVLPTVIITAKGGKIIWVHETDNYRVRPEPDTYLQVLRDAGF